MLFVFTSTTNQGGPRQGKDTPSILKALYIYNFATLTDWPSEYRKGDFTIGIFSSSDNVYNELKKKYNGKSVGQQQISVVKYSSSSQLSKANIIFLDRSSSHMITDINTKLKNKSTLLVTNKSGYLSKGSIINFIEVDSKQSYEINVKNAKKRKLVIASELERLAEKVIR